MAAPHRHRASIVACARWEAPYVAEWAAFHLRLGFDHIYLYCNDDDPSEFEAALHALPSDLASRVSTRWFLGQGRQADMYVDALRRARRESDWLCLLDLDEFLVLKRWPNVPCLLDAMDREGTASMHFNWVFYGNDGHQTRPAGPVLTNYRKRSSVADAHTKHLSRASCFEEARIGKARLPFWHGLEDETWSGFDRRNVLGEPIGPLLSAFPLGMSAYLAEPSRSESLMAAAYVAHFVFKSADDFRIRVARGLQGNFSGQIKWGQLAETGQTEEVLRAMNEVPDTYLSDLSVL